MSNEDHDEKNSYPQFDPFTHNFHHQKQYSFESPPLITSPYDNNAIFDPSTHHPVGFYSDFLHPSADYHHDYNNIVLSAAAGLEISTCSSSEVVSPIIDNSALKYSSLGLGESSSSAVIGEHPSTPNSSTTSLSDEATAGGGVDYAKSEDHVKEFDDKNGEICKKV